MGIFQKIWNSHLICELAPQQYLMAIDRVFLHERTGAAALNSLKQSGRKIKSPNQVFAVMDHIIDTRIGRSGETLMPGGQKFIIETRQAALENEIRLFDVNDSEQGITHLVSPQEGIALPGITLVAPDSHTCTQGAFGALAWGIGSSEAEHALATRTLIMKKPNEMAIELFGKLEYLVSAKDIMLFLLSTLGSHGAQGSIIEFKGTVIDEMEMDERATICNLATELSATSAIIAPDDKTFEFLEGRTYSPKGKNWDLALAYWRSLRSDYSQTDTVSIDCTAIKPMVSWGTSPSQSVSIDDCVPNNANGRAIEYTKLAKGQRIKGVEINAAFIGSCTNARIEDLRQAARILDGKRIHSNIKKALIVPASRQIKRQAENEGLAKIFENSGFEWRDSGCSLCFYAGGESFDQNSRVISTTNRNFEGRQGPGIITHIASPATVAASAINGFISDPREVANA